MPADDMQPVLDGLRSQMMESEHLRLRRLFVFAVVLAGLGALLSFVMLIDVVGPATLATAAILGALLPIRHRAMRHRIERYLALVQALEPRLDGAEWNQDTGLMLFFDNGLAFRSWHAGSDFGDVFSVGFGPDGSPVRLDVRKLNQVARVAVVAKKWSRRRPLTEPSTALDESLEDLNTKLGVRGSTLTLREASPGDSKELLDIRSALDYRLEVFDPRNSQKVMSSLDEVHARLVRWRDMLRQEAAR